MIRVGLLLWWGFLMYEATQQGRPGKFMLAFAFAALGLVMIAVRLVEAKGG